MVIGQSLSKKVPVIVFITIGYIGQVMICSARRAASLALLATSNGVNYCSCKIILPQRDQAKQTNLSAAQQ